MKKAWFYLLSIYSYQNICIVWFNNYLYVVLKWIIFIKKSEIWLMCFLGLYLLCVCACVCVHILVWMYFDIRWNRRIWFAWGLASNIYYIDKNHINVQPHVNKCNRCQGRVYYKLLKLQLTDESQMHHLLANNTTNIIGDDPNSRTRQLEYVYWFIKLFSKIFSIGKQRKRLFKVTYIKNIYVFPPKSLQNIQL